MIGVRAGEWCPCVSSSYCVFWGVLGGVRSSVLLYITGVMSDILISQVLFGVYQVEESTELIRVGDWVTYLELTEST